jgi:phage terminase large subunit
MERPQVRIELPPKLADLLLPPARYKVAYGGRGAGRSWSFAQALIARTYASKLRILCAREVQKSIQDSVHKLLSDRIDALGLLPWFDVQRHAIYSASGSEFLFEGLHRNVNRIKSLEGVDIVWVEEAEAITADSWEKLIPTIRKPGSEIWISFNTNLITDSTYDRFVVSTPPGARVVKVGWEDNPWFDQLPELVAERDYLYRVDPDAAANVWGGDPKKNSDAQVLKGKWCVESFEPVQGWDGPYFGADWGFSQDPTALVKLWIHEQRLYVEHEAYGIGVDIDATPVLFDRVPGAREAVVRADSARPETISYMVRHGYRRMIAVEKWTGSVEDGVAYLRQFERIVIHPRCKHAAEEARLWSYKVDRLTGDITTELVDKHDHVWDSVRYGLQPMIKKRNRGAVRELVM